MPRIAFSSIVKAIVPEPDLDVCKGCSRRFKLGSIDYPIEARNSLMANNVPDVELFVSSTNVDHPSYDDGDYECCVCMSPLAEKDN